MNTPSKKECFKIIETMDMMDHIIDHSIMVSNVAYFLCKKLKKSNNLNIQLTTSAALLHDITKTRSFDTQEIHSETGGIMLSDMGYSEIGNIIRQHVILDSYDNNFPVTEQEIVNYSDKRVLHDKIVSLSKRLEYIKITYSDRLEFKEHIQLMWENTVKLENKIFGDLDILPHQLSECIILNIKKEDWA
jgi:uncharacterized protein